MKTNGKTNGKTIGYWIITGLVALAFLGGGLADLSGAPSITATMSHLGYPAYLAQILGTWKVLAVLALLAPGFPRLKEWAYAGMFFDLSGAALSHGITGDGAAAVMTPLVLIALVVASWALRPASRTVAGAALGAPVPAATPLSAAPRAA
jgi:hypothetical protein